MGVDLLYNSPAGRLLMKCYMKTGGIKFAAWFLNTKASKALIPNFIKKNQIDMKPFGNRET